MDRSVEDCLKLLDITKIKNKEFSKTVNCLYFSENTQENLVLLEVPKKFVGQILSSETGSYDIRFSYDELKSYLITDSETFELIEIETSNSVYLADEIDKEPTDKVEIKKIKLHALLNSHIECNLIKMPKIFEFKSQLLGTMLNEILENPDTILSKEELFRTIPCSRIETLIALRRLKAVIIDDNVRICSSFIMHKVCEEIFNFCDLNGINFNEGIPFVAAVEDLSKLFPTQLVRQIFSYLFYCKKNHENDSIIVFPQPIRICQVYGEYILETISSKFALEDFLKLWQSTLPEGIKTNLNYLISEGRAICHQISPNAKDMLTTPKFYSIEILRSEDLPDSSEEERINKLFSVKSDWEEPHLAGYLKDFLCEQDAEKKSRIGKAYDEGVEYFSDEDIDPDYTKQEEEKELCGHNWHWECCHDQVPLFYRSMQMPREYQNKRLLMKARQTAATMSYSENNLLLLSRMEKDVNKVRIPSLNKVRQTKITDYFLKQQQRRSLSITCPVKGFDESIESKQNANISLCKNTLKKQSSTQPS